MAMAMAMASGCRYITQKGNKGMVDQELVVGVRLQGQSLHMPESNTSSSTATFAMGLFMIIIIISSSRV
jgi:hypothetical protein